MIVSTAASGLLGKAVAAELASRGAASTTRLAVRDRSKLAAQAEQGFEVVRVQAVEVRGQTDPYALVGVIEPEHLCEQLGEEACSTYRRSVGESAEVVPCDCQRNSRSLIA